MHILIDIGHPAHVHYFRNFISLMRKKGHQFVVTARDKEVTFELLNAYNIPFTSRGKGGRGLIGKSIYLFKANILIYKVSKKSKIDLYLSFGSPYAAQVSKLFRKPHIALDDTEHAILEHLMYVPFTNTILTPHSFFKNFGKKQIKFNGFMELCSLHPNYFTPDENIFNEININRSEKFIIVRFVSWEASHDRGKLGLDLNFKIKLVNTLQKYAKVFISTEGGLSKELEKYRLSIAPEKIHSLLSFASLYIGEGATTASECAVLGTPAIYVNPLNAGTLQEQEKLGLIFSFRDSTGVLAKAIELLSSPKLKTELQKRRHQMLSKNIDLTALLVWFIENYPISIKMMIENPEYQLNFR